MTPLDAAVIRRKLRRIRENISVLAAAIEGLDNAAYTADAIRRRAVERLLQETVDAAVDVNNHLLRGLQRRPAQDYFASFIDVGRAGIIDDRLAAALAPVAGLRNRIVHEYEDLDDQRVLEAAREAPALMREFVAAVETFLDAQSL